MRGLRTPLLSDGATRCWTLGVAPREALLEAAKLLAGAGDGEGFSLPEPKEGSLKTGPRFKASAARRWAFALRLSVGCAAERAPSGVSPSRVPRGLKVGPFSPGAARPDSIFLSDG